MKDARRAWLLGRLARYAAFDEEEARMAARLTAFVLAHGDCFDRRSPAGHVVASAWIVDRRRARALLVHHRKLGRWLQPGGHVENDPSLIDAARREAVEECGLRRITLLSGEIFDIDVHPIPARGAEPEHLHHDVRFVFEAPPGSPVSASEESLEARWFPLEEIAARNPSPSIARLVAKTRRMPSAVRRASSARKR